MTDIVERLRAWAIDALEGRRLIGAAQDIREAASIIEARRPNLQIGPHCMTPAELKAARKALGMTQSEFADALLLSPKNGGRTVRVWESEGSTIPGPVQIAVNCLLNHGPDKRGTRKPFENSPANPRKTGRQ
jgi:DNA-binding transcriptional regulator YiaG